MYVISPTYTTISIQYCQLFRVISRYSWLFIVTHVIKPTAITAMHCTTKHLNGLRIKIYQPTRKSDHAVLQFTCCFRGVAKPSNTLLLKKCYNKADYVSMREKVKKDLNKGTSSASTVEEKWNRLKGAIQTAEAKYTPVRPHNPLADNSKRSTPPENKTVKLIQKKHGLWTRYMGTRDKKYHQEFRKIRNKVKSLTRQAKREYEKSIAIQAKSNPKKFWNHARSKSRQV